MIIVANGETLTSTTTEDEVMFVAPDDDGKIRPVGRQLISFSVLSGSVQVAVGKAVDTSKATAHTTSAAQNFSLTIANQSYPADGPREGGPRNLRIVGTGTVAVTW